MEQVAEWAKRAGDGLDELPDEERREVLLLLLDGAPIAGENNVTLTLAIPTEEFVSIGTPGSGYRNSNQHQTLRYSWAANLPPLR